MDDRILVKNYALSNLERTVNIFYPTYKSIFGTFDLIPTLITILKNLKTTVYFILKNLIIKKFN